MVLQNYDEQADVWSVGILMYQLLTGRFPFWEDIRNLTLQQVSPPLLLGPGQLAWSVRVVWTCLIAPQALCAVGAAVPPCRNSVAVMRLRVSGRDSRQLCC